MIAGVFIDFYQLFAGFHAIFFEGDTWLFFTNDTLIRLFPEKLWSDAFIYLGMFTLISALVCACAGRKLAQRN
jgi:integral membrane protein (TIGR01906 family)